MTFDRDHFMAVCDGDAEFGAELLAEFLASAPPNLARIEEAVMARDPGALSREAHQLKGSSNAIGGSDFALVCRELEVIGREDRRMGAEEAMERLRLEWDKLSQLLTNEIRQLAA